MRSEVYAYGAARAALKALARVSPSLRPTLFLSFSSFHTQKESRRRHPSDVGPMPTKSNKVVPHVDVQPAFSFRNESTTPALMGIHPLSCRCVLEALEAHRLEARVQEAGCWLLKEPTWPALKMFQFQ